jgi:hypothetical protein
VLTRDRIRDWLEQADFNGDGCQHSYVTIGLAVGCSETHAIRCVRELEKAGDLEIDRAPRGSKRPNTYRVRDRNPRLRAPVLLRLAEIRKLRRELCQSKGTAGSRGLNRPGKDNRSNVLVNQRCGRETRNRRFERSRGVPEPARPLRLVPSHCPDCEQKDRIIASLESMVRDLEIDLANANGDLTAKRRQLNEAKAQVRKLKQDREQELKETPVRFVHRSSRGDLQGACCSVSRRVGGCGVGWFRFGLVEREAWVMDEREIEAVARGGLPTTTSAGRSGVIAMATAVYVWAVGRSCP